MDDQILNKDIKIGKVESYDNRLKVIDETGNWYKVWYTKKDGADTQAYSAWKAMGLHPGSVVNIGYKEEDAEYKGKSYKDRTALTFRETTGTGMSTNGYNGHDQKKKEQDDFGKRLAM